MSVQPALGGEVRRVLARHVAVLADAEPDVQAVGLIAEVDEQVPHGQAVLAARDGDEDASSFDSMSNFSIAFTTWRRHSSRKCSAQKLALWRGRSMIAGSLQTRHFEPAAHHQQPPEMTGRISTVVVGAELGVAGHQRAVADDQVRLAGQVELGEQRVDAALAVEFDLATRVPQEHLHRDHCARRQAVRGLLARSCV